MTENIENQEKSELKSFKDVESFENLDFNKIELIRGETPQDINERCLQLCKDYLSGNWSQQTVDTIEVRRITGGMINQIYYCGIKTPDTNESVPQEVAIKLYGTNILSSFENSRVRDVVIALSMSEHKLGPKIYGLFENGQIQKFYKHRQFKEEEQKNPDLRNQVFRTLAKIHSFEVPIKKNTNWMFDLMIKSYTEAIVKFPIEKELEEFNCVVMKSSDFKAEIDWVIGVVEKLDSPVVFTHSDFRSSNLLITEPNDELIVCDFDVTSYGYRSFDFVNLSREWGRKQFDFNPFKGLPFKDEEFRALISIYVEECVRIHGKSYSENEINSVDNILKELKVFFLFATIFGAMYFMNNDEANGGFPFSRKLGMGMVENMMSDYFAVKEQLKQQKIIE